ncbi:hypothetical protein LTR28_010760 [Elasticomyces elasticus]|nr:hypothetical protein LTR28_010760 [Elasticomyces elasticus]
MSKLPQTPNIGQLDIADSDPEDLFASPEQARGKKKNKGKQNANDAVPAASVSRTAESQYDAEEARESALRNELESVRSINKAIEGVVESLEKAKDNMEVCLKYPDWLKAQDLECSRALPYAHNWILRTSRMKPINGNKWLSEER